jgi:hypothetical protein
MTCNASASSHHLRRLLRTLIPALLLVFGQQWRALAQDHLSEDQIKAGFLLNFLRFVQWPDGTYPTPDAPIIICLVGHYELSTILSGAISGKEVDGRQIRVRLMKPSEDMRTCSLVFIGAGEERHTAQVLDNLKHTNALTVSEYPAFAKSGGMLNFYTEENKVKLEMNLDAATHANLKISAKLIAVSHLISTKPAARGL